MKAAKEPDILNKEHHFQTQIIIDMRKIVFLFYFLLVILSCGGEVSSNMKVVTLREILLDSRDTTYWHIVGGDLYCKIRGTSITDSSCVRFIRHINSTKKPYDAIYFISSGYWNICKICYDSNKVTYFNLSNEPPINVPWKIHNYELLIWGDTFNISRYDADTLFLKSNRSDFILVRGNSRSRASN
jgi:hypothetical protein